MATALFESYNEAGAITVSSRYPLLALQMSVNVTTVSDGYNALAYITVPVVKVEDGPVSIVRPKTVGAYFFTTGYRGIQGEATSQPTVSINAVSLRTISWDWKPIAGNFDVSLYYQGMYDSGANFGLQTFDENSVLTYDAQTPAMGIHSVAKDSAWVLDKIVPRTISSGASYKVHFYSTPFPRDADGFRQIRNLQFTSSSEFGGGNAYYGCETDLDRLTCTITTADEFPTTITAPPWVMFVKKTVI